MLELQLNDILQDLGEVLSQSAQGLVQKYKDKYVTKLLDEPKQVKREVDLMNAAGDLSVGVIGYIYTGPLNNLEGFVMPLLTPINASIMSLKEKMGLFRQMRSAIPSLHQRGIIHGDINLSNMLLDAQNTLKLCDFGTAAFANETFFPSAFSLRSCSPYRLREGAVPPLIPEEDEYALGIAVWELFTGEKAFGEIHDEDDLEKMIRMGKKVDIEIVEVEEVRKFIQKCLNIFEE